MNFIMCIGSYILYNFIELLENWAGNQWHKKSQTNSGWQQC